MDASDTAKESFRQHLLSISQSARAIVPMLKNTAVGEISGVPVTLENVMLLVNPQDGSVGFWNANDLWDRSADIFRSLEIAVNDKKRELQELDEELAKRRQSVGVLEFRIPPKKFDVN